MAKLVLVLGPQGVGKTAVVRRAREILEKEFKHKFEIINFGDILQDIVGTDRDEFRRTAHLGEFAKVQEKTAKKIAEMINDDKNIFLTSHAVLWRKAGFFPGFPIPVLAKLKPDSIVLIMADPEDVISRKLKDEISGKAGKRTRDRVSAENIQHEANAEELISYSYSMYTGAPVKTIINKEGRLDEAAMKLVDAINNI